LTYLFFSIQKYNQLYIFTLHIKLRFTKFYFWKNLLLLGYSVWILIS